MIFVVVTAFLRVLFFVLISKFQHTVSNKPFRAVSRVTFAIFLNISVLISIIDSLCKCVSCTETLMINLRVGDNNLFGLLMNNLIENISLIQNRGQKIGCGLL